MDIRNIIRGFIMEKISRDARKLELKDSDSLLGRGLIDSMGMVQIISFLQKKFKINIPDEDLTPDNFDSMECIITYVENKLGKK